MPAADIKLGYTCNNNCIHCVIADHRIQCIERGIPIDLTTKEFKKELLKSKKQGYDSIVFTGGEPTMRKDFIELLNFANYLCLSIALQTNGRMFYYKDFVREVCKIPRIFFVIAVHGHNAEVHDSITRVKGSFRQTIAGIQNLIDLKQKVCGKVVISKLNMFNLENITKLFKNLGVNNLTFAFPHAQGNAMKYFGDVVPKYSEVMNNIYKTIEYCKENMMNVKFEAIPLCLMKGYETMVGDVKRHQEKRRLKFLSSEEMDWNVVRKKIKSKFEQCRECKYDDICEGVWEEYPDKYGSEEFIPVK